MSGPKLPPMMPRFSEVIHEKLSIILTYAFSYCPLDLMLNNFNGEWKYLRKTVAEVGTVKATQACIELAIAIRALDEQESIFSYDNQVGKIKFGLVIKKDQSNEQLCLRELTNKILHAKDLNWDFSNSGNPKIICVPNNLDGWIRAEIEVVAVAAYCGNLMH